MGGIDGAALGTAPESHTLHCLWEVAACEKQGYIALEELTTTAADGSKYAPKYQLDAAGNQLALKLFKDEQTRAGDRKFDEQITINGDVVGDRIDVSSLCFRPKKDNPSGSTTCHNAADLANRTGGGTVAVSFAQHLHLGFVAAAIFAAVSH